MTRLILGHTTHESIKIWVRGSKRWPVAFVDVLDNSGRRTSPTKSIVLDEEEFWTDTVTWSALNSSRYYLAKVAFASSIDAPPTERVRDAYTEGKFKTFPKPRSKSKFSFLLGSCNLHSTGFYKRPDKAWGRITEIARDRDARFMIHCGDQIYADIPFRPKPDLDHYRNKYLDAWDDCRTARALLTKLPHYMILDDHEIDNNFDNDMHTRGRDQEALLRAAMKVYWEFQHKHNPESDAASSPRCYHYKFNYGDTQFFALDTRYRRESSIGQMIDEHQMHELKSWLIENIGKLKFIITSVPFVGQVRKPNKDKWCDPLFANQRHEILKFLYDNQIYKTVFLTGDMHASYLGKVVIGTGANKVVAHELMSSPINQLTPNQSVEERFVPRSTPFDVGGGITAVCSIQARHFYGNHSSIMAVEVNGTKIKFRIYRTRKSGPVAKSGIFTP